MSVSLIFPAVSAEARAYGMKYLNERAVELGITNKHSGKAEVTIFESILDSNIVTLPRLLTLDDISDNDLIFRLQSEQRKYLISINEHFPLLEKEVIVKEAACVTDELFFGCPKGTLIYKRVTNLGELAILHREIIVDAITGRIISSKRSKVVAPYLESFVHSKKIDQNYFEEVSDNDLWQDTDDTIDYRAVIDTIFNFSETLAFAAGNIAGPLIAGMIGILHRILDSSLPETESLTLVLTKAFKTLLDQKKIVDASNKFSTDLSWYKTQYLNATDKERQKLGLGKELTELVLSDPDKLIAYINSMQYNDGEELSQNFRLRAFPAFMAGVQLYQTLSLALIQYLNNNRMDTVSTAKSISVQLGKYTDYAEDLYSQIDKAVSDRLGKISDLVNQRVTVSGVGYPSSSETYWCTYFTDPLASRNYIAEYIPDCVAEYPYKNSTACKAGDPDLETAKAGRIAHYEKVFNQISKKYYNLNDERVAKTLKNWRTAEDWFKKLGKVNS